MRKSASIYLRDPQTVEVFASCFSRRTSLARKANEFMAREALREVFEKTRPGSDPASP